MSDEIIRSLQSRINELTSENVALKAESKGRRVKLSRSNKERETLRQQVATLTSDRDKWQQQAESNPTELNQKLKALESEIRQRDVRDKFATVAKGLVEGTSLDALFKLTDFDPAAEGSETVDPTDLVTRAKALAPSLFRPASAMDAAAPGGATGKRPLDLVGVPASGRGARDTHSSSFTFRASDLRDPAWMKQNAQAWLEARQAGTAVELPD